MIRELVLSERKAVRAQVVWEAWQGLRVRYPLGVVCFTCGHAAQALRDCAPAGGTVLECGRNGSLKPTRWFTGGEVACEFPLRMDATSGHLPLWLMALLAKALRAHVGPLLEGEVYAVPTGSGETVVALRMAYPGVRFKPVWGEREHLMFDLDNPLATLLRED